jgi:methyl-accepting chemotaxis protein
MNRLKLGLRLSIGFGVMIALILIIAIVSVTRMAEQSRTTDEIIRAGYPKVNAVQTISYLVMDRARLIRNLILQTDAAQKTAAKDSMDQDRALISEQMALLEKTMVTDEGKSLLKAMGSARAEYGPFVDDVVALATQGKTAEASELLFGERYKTQGAYLASLSAMLKFQEDNMAKSGQHAADVYGQASLLVVAATCMAVLMGMALAYFVTRSITVPLGHAVAATDRVANGDLSVPIESPSQDETGLLLSALQRMQQNLALTVSRVRSCSDNVATASSEIAQGNQDLSGRTESQASALQETAAAMEELGSTVRANADNARQANQLAQTASSVAVKGGHVVSQVVDTMQGINDASKKIFDIISVIDGIAFQTNILALNAAVEAARAGEQGRGFAVVASEVRSLAGRSADAAREIKSLINASVERVEQGTALVDQAGVTMGELVSSIRKVTNIMGEISAASGEQAAGVTQIGDAVTQMDTATQQNAALVEQMAAAASSLNHQSQDMVQAVAVFKLGHDRDTAHVATPYRAATQRMPTARELLKIAMPV